MAPALKHWKEVGGEWTRQLTSQPEPPEAVLEVERRLIELCDYAKENGVSMYTDHANPWVQPRHVKFKYLDPKKV